MAEICLDCWNKINETEDDEKKYVLSKEFDLCEECGEWKPVIIMERKAYYMRKLRFLILPFKIIYYVFYILWKLLTLPHSIFIHAKSKKKR